MRNWVASAWLGVLVCAPSSAFQVECEVLGNLDSGYRQGGVAFDGSALWVAEDFTTAIHRVDPGTGEVLATIESPDIHTLGLAWDGAALWAAPAETDMLFRLDPVSGEILSEIPAPTFGDPGGKGSGLAFDGTALWHADYGRRRLRRVDPSDGTWLAELTSPGVQPFGLGMNGPYLVVSDSLRDDLEMVDTTDGLVVASCPVPDGAARGLAIGSRGVAYSAGWVTQSLHLVQLPYSEPQWYETLCQGTPRPSGSAAFIAPEGSPSLAAGDLAVSVGDLPEDWVLLLVGPNHVERPFHGGTLCLGRPVRVVGLRRAHGGSASFDVFRRGYCFRRIGPDETWFFQAIYHDRFSNRHGRLGISDALAVTFEP